MSTGTLYLIPAPLGKQRQNLSLPDHTLQVARSLKQFVVENIRTTQGFLQWINHPLKPHEVEFRVLNKKTPEHEIFGFLKLLEEGDVGLMSEAGAPAVADPGAQLVRMAHDRGFRVVPLTGPSSILLALMASGLNGQQFAFHGYLPVDPGKRKEKIRELEKESAARRQTQIIMETPHRNRQMLESLVKSCRPETKLCVAANLTMPDEMIRTQTIDKWSKALEDGPGGRPALFLILAG